MSAGATTMNQEYLASLAPSAAERNANAAAVAEAIAAANARQRERSRGAIASRIVLPSQHNNVVNVEGGLAMAPEAAAAARNANAQRAEAARWAALVESRKKGAAAPYMTGENGFNAYNDVELGTQRPETPPARRGGRKSRRSKRRSGRKTRSSRR